MPTATQKQVRVDKRKFGFTEEPPARESFSGSRMHIRLIYSLFMDIAAIVHELDFEIAKLQRVRAIIQSLETPIARRATRARVRSKTSVPITAPAIALGTEPKRVLLPAKKKREYQPRVKPSIKETTALAGNFPTQPVFVRRSILAKSAERPAQTVEASPDALEAAIRQKLLGVPAAGFAEHVLAAG